MKNSGNLLVLGASGFLGKNVIEILEKEHEYKVFKLHGKSELDLTKDDLLASYLSKNNIDYIINCAAFVGGIAYGYDFPAELLSKNTTMASNIYEASHEARVKFIVNPISNCAYPKDQNLYEEKNFWNGAPHESVFEYGFSKKFFVAMGNAFFKEYNLGSANIVLSNMYGPNDHFDEIKSHALGALITKIVNAKVNKLENIEVWGTGKPIREWLYVKDGANALIKSVGLANGSYFFNIGVNKGMSIKNLAILIAECVDWNGEFIYNTSKPDGAMEKRVLGTFSEENFNWSPTTTLENGVKTTVEWYKENILKI
jgi:GDP-L-fucose synthase